MSGNLFLGFLSVILAFSPILVRNAFVGRFLQIGPSPHGLNGFEIMVLSVGGLGVVLTLHNLFIKKKNGSLHIVIGALVLFTGFFYNGEKLPLPNVSSLFEVEMFFIFVVSFLLSVSGIIVEWLIA